MLKRSKRCAGKPQYQCTYTKCNACCESQAALLVHLKTHEDLSTIRCAHCPVQSKNFKVGFRSYFGLDCHLEKAHGKLYSNRILNPCDMCKSKEKRNCTRFHCVVENCERWCYTQAGLHKHMNSHNVKDNAAIVVDEAGNVVEGIPCEYCVYNGHDRLELAQHMEKTHSIPCSTIKRMFKSKRGFRNWLDAVEKITNAKYVHTKAFTTSDRVKHAAYECDWGSKHALKCLANAFVQQYPDGRVLVLLQPRHTGHVHGHAKAPPMEIQRRVRKAMVHNQPKKPDGTSYGNVLIKDEILYEKVINYTEISEEEYDPHATKKKKRKKRKRSPGKSIVKKEMDQKVVQAIKKESNPCYSLFRTNTARPKRPTVSPNTNTNVPDGNIPPLRISPDDESGLVANTASYEFAIARILFNPPQYIRKIRNSKNTLFPGTQTNWYNVPIKFSNFLTNL